MLLLKILIVLLLFFFPYGEIIRFNLGNNIFIKPIDAISILILLWTAVLYSKNKKLIASLKWYFFLFPLVGLVSLLINSYWLKANELLTSSLYLIRWVSLLGVFFSILSLDKKFQNKLKWFLLIDGMIVLLIGYIQFFLYPGLKNLYYQGWDDHLYRMFSSFLDPNFVGAFFVLYFIFVAGLLFGNTKKRREIVFYSLLLIITLIALFLTYSRSALIMLLISGVTFFILIQRKKFIIYLLLAIVLFIIIISPYFYLVNINLFRSFSGQARIGDIENGLTIFKDHPLIGVGFNSYRYAQINYHFVNPNSPFPSHSASGTDNSFVFILATTGIFGLAAYVYLWYQLFRSAKKGNRKYLVVFISSAIGFFINSLFNNSLFYPEIMLWMWMITGLLFAKE